MNNYQLYSTNLLLGGQVKWDLVLESRNNALQVADFNLSPISNNTSYIYQVDNSIINNSHQENIKLYYKRNKGIFFSECLNSDFSHNMPIICEENKVINSYSNIYDMGCSRTVRYNDYHKEFEFFCPVWIEKLESDASLAFTIEIRYAESNQLIGSNTLILKNVNNKGFHNSFVNYFNNYLKDAGIQAGTDDLMNINFKQNTATVTGLNVFNGLFQTNYVNNIISNLQIIERPLMETNNILINAFKDNNLICKQLFNFNLCFNIEDIFSKTLVSYMYGENIKVSVKVFEVKTINDKEVYTQLELKDFYTDYNYIPRYSWPSNSDAISSDNKNVLSYLQDNKYIEHINKNKFCQAICHWSLCENNDYIFNVYDGFSGIYIDQNDNIFENAHQYENAPNIFLNTYSKQQNSIGWASSYSFSKINNIILLFNNTELFKQSSTYLNGNNDYGFINNIKYTNIPNTGNNGLYLINIATNNETFSLLKETLAGHITEIFGKNKNIVMIKKDNMIMFVASDTELLTLNIFLNNLKKVLETENDDVLKIIYEWLSSKVNPNIISFKSQLNYAPAKGPSTDINEIEYYKVLKNNYVIRYDGKIKPTFVSKHNTIYYKDYISKNKFKQSVYSKYSLLNYELNYPSIDYCGIKSYNNVSYNICPKITVSEFGEVPVSIYDNDFEYKWYNESKCVILNPKLKFSFTKKISDSDISDASITTEITNYIKQYYNINDDDSNKPFINYIKDKYNYKIRWDYKDDTDINTYKYNIELILKTYM